MDGNLQTVFRTHCLSCGISVCNKFEASNDIFYSYGGSVTKAKTQECLGCGCPKNTHIKVQTTLPLDQKFVNFIRQISFSRNNINASGKLVFLFGGAQFANRTFCSSYISSIVNFLKHNGFFPEQVYTLEEETFSGLFLKRKYLSKNGRLRKVPNEKYFANELRHLSSFSGDPKTQKDSKPFLKEIKEGMQRKGFFGKKMYLAVLVKTGKKSPTEEIEKWDKKTKEALDKYGISLLYYSKSRLSAFLDQVVFFPNRFKVKINSIFLRNLESASAGSEQGSFCSKNDMMLAKLLDNLERSDWALSAVISPPKKPESLLLHDMRKVDIVARIIGFGPSSFLNIEGIPGTTQVISQPHELRAIDKAYFPQLVRGQLCVLVFRPFVVNAKLVDFFLQIFQINSLRVLHRQQKVLTTYEVTLLSRIEQISLAQETFYSELMQSGECEIVILSGDSTVSICQFLVNGFQEAKHSSSFSSTQENKKREGVVQSELLHVLTQATGTQPEDIARQTEEFNGIKSVVDYEMAYLEMMGMRSRSLGFSSVDMQPVFNFVRFREEHEKFDVFMQIIEKMNPNVYCSKTQEEAYELANVFARAFTSISAVTLVIKPQYASQLNEICEFLTEFMGFTLIQSTTGRVSVISIDEFVAGAKRLFGLSEQEEKMVQAEWKNKEFFLVKVSKLFGIEEARHLTQGAQLFQQKHFEKRMGLPQIFGQSKQSEMLDIFPNIAIVCGNEKEFRFFSDFTEGRLEFSMAREINTTHSFLGDTPELRMSTYTLNTLGAKVRKIEKKFPELTFALTSRARETVERFEVELDRPDGLHAVVSIRQLADSFQSALSDKLKEFYMSKFERQRVFYEKVNFQYNFKCPNFYHYRMQDAVKGATTVNVYEVYETLGEDLVTVLVRDYFVNRPRETGLTQEKLEQTSWYAQRYKISRNERGSVAMFMWGAKLAVFVKKIEKISINKYAKSNEAFNLSKLRDSEEFNIQDSIIQVEKIQAGQLFSRLEQISRDEFNKELNLLKTMVRKVQNSISYQRSRSREHLRYLPMSVELRNLTIKSYGDVALEKKTKNELVVAQKEGAKNTDGLANIEDYLMSGIEADIYGKYHMAGHLRYLIEHDLKEAIAQDKTIGEHDKSILIDSFLKGYENHYKIDEEDEEFLNNLLGFDQNSPDNLDISTDSPSGSPNPSLNQSSLKDASGLESLGNESSYTSKKSEAHSHSRVIDLFKIDYFFVLLEKIENLVREHELKENEINRLLKSGFSQRDSTILKLNGDFDVIRNSLGILLKETCSLKLRYMPFVEKYVNHIKKKFVPREKYFKSTVDELNPPDEDAIDDDKKYVYLPTFDPKELLQKYNYISFLNEDKMTEIEKQWFTKREVRVNMIRSEKKKAAEGLYLDIEDDLPAEKEQKAYLKTYIDQIPNFKTRNK